MNKNLKKIIAMALTIGTILSVGPITKVNFLTAKAYASSDSNDIDKLYSLRVETPNGSGIKLYYDDSYDKYNNIDSDDVKDGHTYYAKTSASTIKVEPDGPDSKYIRVFNGTNDSTKGQDINSNINLSQGINTITVRVYKEEPDKYLEYEDEAKVESTYTINIKYNPDGNGDSDDNGVYLKNLTVDDNDIELSQAQTSYNYGVANNVDSVSIKAKPEDDDYKVTIDGDDVDESDSFKKNVVLNDGENDIKIEIEDSDDDYKEYTLKINKGNSASAAGVAASADNKGTANLQSSSAGNVVATNTTVATLKTNQWVQVSGGWQYNDSTGNPLKNKWVLDKNLGKWYYLGADGFMSENCWILSSGKYYYLNADGSMAANTTISGYKVGADGAWIN